jgi:hypothetical protein
MHAHLEPACCEAPECCAAGTQPEQRRRPLESGPGSAHDTCTAPRKMSENAQLAHMNSMRQPLLPMEHEKYGCSNPSSMCLHK